MELESLHGEPIDLYANDTLIARGEVVVVGEQFGVRITEIATPKDRIVSIR
jgi:flagellar motor switch protein FliN/FliY